MAVHGSTLKIFGPHSNNPHFGASKCAVSEFHVSCVPDISHSIISNNNWDPIVHSLVKDEMFKHYCVMYYINFRGPPCHKWGTQLPATGKTLPNKRPVHQRKGDGLYNKQQVWQGRVVPIKRVRLTSTTAWSSTVHVPGWTSYASKSDATTTSQP